MASKLVEVGLVVSSRQVVTSLAISRQAEVGLGTTNRQEVAG